MKTILWWCLLLALVLGTGICCQRDQEALMSQANRESQYMAPSLGNWDLLHDRNNQDLHLDDVR